MTHEPARKTVTREEAENKVTFPFFVAAFFVCLCLLDRGKKTKAIETFFFDEEDLLSLSIFFKEVFFSIIFPR